MDIKIRAQARVRGRWEKNHIAWHEQTTVYCDCCGILIPKKEFVVETAGLHRRFCGPDCAQLPDRIRRLNKPQDLNS